MNWQALQTTDVCFVFLYILMCYLLHNDRKHEGIVRNGFILLQITALTFFTLGFVGELVNGIPSAYRWCSLITCLKYTLNPAMLYEILLISERESPARRKLLFGIPLAVLALTLAVSFPFGWVFSHSPATNNWREGPLLPVTWLTLLIYMVLIIISSIRLHGFHQESQLLLMGESFILLNIINERVIQFFPHMERTVIMVAILAYYLYHRSIAEAEYRAKKEKELNRAQIQAMISQIKPHFIYNSLACIAETCHKDALKGEEAVVTFSDYLRSCFRSLTDDGLVPFSEELRTIESYLELEILQAPEKLSVSYDIKERFFRVPVLSIETLVENAVKHGIRKKHGSGTVTLSTRREERGILISISDDGIGFDVKSQIPDENHLGLKNAKMRLREQCGATMAVHSEPGRGTKVTILIPEEAHR